MPKVILCLEEEAAKEPALIGLADENLQAQRWLGVYTSAEQARRALINSNEVLEAWVEGSDLVDAINLAATMKSDRPDVRVCLVTNACSGSLLSRAHAAQLSAVYDEKMFVHRYSAVKAALAYPSRSREERRSEGVSKQAQGGEGLALQHAGKDGLVLSRASNKRAFLLTVVSGSGGAGKSTVAALAALCAQIHGVKTLLMDFDLQFGNVASFFKDAAHVPMDELLAEPGIVNKIAPLAAVPAIISAPRRLEDSEVISRHVDSLLSLVETRFDLIVANTGSSWAEEHAALLERSSKALFLVDQRASSLVACKHALELCERCGIATGQFLYAVNHCARDALYTSIDIACAMKGAEACELKEGGREVEDCSSAGQLVDLALSGNPLYVSLEGALSSFVPGIEAKASQHSSNGKTAKWSWRRGKKGGGAHDAA